MNKKILLAPVAAALIAGAVACGPTHTTSPQAKASVSALASVPGADAKQVLIHAGVPINGTSAQQIAFFKSMSVKANREALAVKLHIPPQNKAPFEAALLDAAKQDYRHPVTQFLDKDLPNLYARYA